MKVAKMIKTLVKTGWMTLLPQYDNFQMIIERNSEIASVLLYLALWFV